MLFFYFLQSRQCFSAENQSFTSYLDWNLNRILSYLHQILFEFGVVVPRYVFVQLVALLFALFVALCPVLLLAWLVVIIKL